jgi:acid stress-induced BolA-like protein IbaG/YrbA
VFAPECTISGYQSCEASILVYWTQNDFGSVSEHFANLRHVKRWKTCVSCLNALFRGTKLAKGPFNSIGTKMMFGIVSEHFANLRHVKRCKTCVSGVNALFRGTKVANHPFYSIGTKMMFGSVSEHFTNLRHVKICKTCVSSLNALFRVPKLRRIHSAPLEPNWCLGVF